MYLMYCLWVCPWAVAVRPFKYWGCNFFNGKRITKRRNAFLWLYLFGYFKEKHIKQWYFNYHNHFLTIFSNLLYFVFVWIEWWWFDFLAFLEYTFTSNGSIIWIAKSVSAKWQALNKRQHISPLITASGQTWDRLFLHQNR